MKNFLVLAVFGIILLSGCTTTPPTTTSSSSTSSSATSSAASSSSSSSSTSSAQSVSVTIQNYAFSPKTITIHAGDTVTWTNMDSFSHTVTSDSGSELSSGNIASGQSFSHTFTAAGTYTYHCSIHTSMTATIVVQ